MIPQEALGGGFTSRIIFVVEEKKRKIVPEYTITPEVEELGNKLQRDPERISQLNGSVKFTDAGKKLYVDWYTEESHRMEAGEPVIKDKRFAGYCERRATHIRKLMLICSACRGDDLLIHPEDFNKALGLLKQVEVNMGKTFGGLGRARFSDETEIVVNFLREMKITTRSKLLNVFFRDLDVETLNRIETQLTEMKCIKIKLMILLFVL